MGIVTTTSVLNCFLFSSKKPHFEDEINRFLGLNDLVITDTLSEDSPNVSQVVEEEVDDEEVEENDGLSRVSTLFVGFRFRHDLSV